MVERILVGGPSRGLWIKAKVDTGATRTTIDSRLAERLGLGPVLGIVKIKTSATNASVQRPVVKARLRVSGEDFTVNVGVTDRSILRYRAIIGKDILSSGRFLIDPTKPKPA